MPESKTLKTGVHSLPATLTLFTIIILEGYVVLSTELLAIRQSLPFTGSGTETISIIIAAVLMPLAFGYYRGGSFKPRPGFSVRKKLITNILVAMVFLFFALSYIPLATIYDTMNEMGVHHRLAQISLYSMIFLVTPVYLLGQTIPLITNYFSSQSLSRFTGRILFLSTLGSFLGAILTTLVLMATVGVNNTVGLIFIILTFLIFLLSKQKNSRLFIGTFIFAVLAVSINSGVFLQQFNIVQSNAYNTIKILTKDGEHHLLLNNSFSSKYTDDGRKYAYLELAEKLAIDPIRDSETPKEILVLGAGAFTFGFEDENNNYDYVDVDKNLKEIAEDYILPHELYENKTFHPMPARAFLAQTDQKYDVIFLDTYYGYLSLPEHLLTAEFFHTIKEHLTENGIMLINFVGSPNFVDPYTRTVDNTVRSVFPYVSRYVWQDNYKPWNNNEKLITNIMYIYRNFPDLGDPKIYTDNKNRTFLDKP